MHFGGFPNLIIDFTNIYNCIDHAIILFDTFLWFHHIGMRLFVCSYQIYAMNILHLSDFHCLSISIKNELKTEKNQSVQTFLCDIERSLYFIDCCCFLPIPFVVSLFDQL